MERLELPKGITVNGQTKYFRDTNDTVDRLPKNEHIDHHALKKTSIKGRAFNKPKEPGKLQRVIETINYSKERIKEMEYQKYYDENKEHLTKTWMTGILMDAIIPAIGLDGKEKSAKDIHDILDAENKKSKRTVSKYTHGNLSYHLSYSWTKFRTLSLFIKRNTKGVYLYKVTDIGLRIGPKLLFRFRNIAISKSFDKLRMALSEMRLLAKHRGVSEKEFNQFIRIRHAEVMELKNGHIKGAHGNKPQHKKSLFDEDTTGLKKAVESTPLKPEHTKVVESIFKPITRTVEEYELAAGVTRLSPGTTIIEPDKPETVLSEQACTEIKEALTEPGKFLTATEIIARNTARFKDMAESKPDTTMERLSNDYETTIGQIKDKSGVDTYLQGNVPLTLEQLEQAAKILNDKNIPVDDRIVQTNEPELTASDNNISSIENQRSFSKIKFDIKVWFIPVTGVIELL